MKCPLCGRICKKVDGTWECPNCTLGLQLPPQKEGKIRHGQFNVGGRQK